MKAFFDIDTQLDFMVPGGALYGPGAERLIPAVTSLNQYAGHHHIRLISTTDSHPEDAQEFRTWPPHCVSGTFGQAKPSSTLLPKRSVLPWNNLTFDLATLDLTASQIIVEKNNLDMFTNPHLPALLTALGVTDCFVYGVFTDYCVKYAIMGLLDFGVLVSLVTDASAHISAEAGDAVVRDFVARGGRLVCADEARI